MRRSLILLAGAFSVGCALAASDTPPTAKPELGTWGVDLTAMDHSVKPGDDFFMFVNGNWMKTTEIPPERSSIGAFQLLILYHVGMAFVPWDFQVKDADPPIAWATATAASGEATPVRWMPGSTSITTSSIAPADASASCQRSTYKPARPAASEQSNHASWAA